MNESSNKFIASVKIISVLLIICIVCGTLLALCNDLLYIDDETKFNRAIKKVYPKFERDTTLTETPIASAKDLAGAGSVSKVYLSKDGTYVIEAVGQGGFNSGTVTMYVAVGGTTPNVTIKGVAITSNAGQSWIGKVTQSELNSAYVGKSLESISGVTSGADYKLGGTTYTSNAILNCIKTAVNYCITGLKLVSTPESEARDAAIALLGSNYDYTTVTDENYKTALGYDFYFTAVNDGESYDVYVYVTADGTHEVIAINSTLKRADRLTDDAIKAKTDGITPDRVTAVQGLSHIESQVRQLGVEGFTCDVIDNLGDDVYQSDDGKTRITKVYRSDSGAMAIFANCDPGSFGTLQLMVIINDNKIAAWDVVNIGGHNLFEGKYANQDPRPYYGNDITSITQQNVTGATYSGNALYNIISLCAKYAGEISK